MYSSHKSPMTKILRSLNKFQTLNAACFFFFCMNSGLILLTLQFDRWLFTLLILLLIVSSFKTNYTIWQTCICSYRIDRSQLPLGDIFDNYNIIHLTECLNAVLRFTKFTSFDTPLRMKWHLTLDKHSFAWCYRSIELLQPAIFCKFIGCYRSFYPTKCQMWHFIRAISMETTAVALFPFGTVKRSDSDSVDGSMSSANEVYLCEITSVHLKIKSSVSVLIPNMDWMHLFHWASTACPVLVIIIILRDNSTNPGHFVTHFVAKLLHFSRKMHLNT